MTPSRIRKDASLPQVDCCKEAGSQLLPYTDRILQLLCLSGAVLVGSTPWLLMTWLPSQYPPSVRGTDDPHMRKSSKKALAAQLFELMMGIFLVQQILGHADLLSHRLMVVDGGRILSQQNANPTCPRRFPSDVAISFCGGGRVDDEEWQVELTFEKDFFGGFSRARRTEQVEQ